MTFFTLIRRSLRFHARAHLGVVVGAAVSSAALTGALVVGDSVQGTLRERALERLGNTQFVLDAKERLFKRDLATRFASQLSTNRPSSSAHPQESTPVASLLILPASAVRQDGQARANHVRLLGIDPAFGAFAHGESLFHNLPPDGIVVNEALASQLHLQKGDTVIFRAPKASALARDAVVSPKSDQAIALRLVVQDVAPAAALANFNLAANQTPPLNAFVGIATLEQAVGAKDGANLLLVGQTSLLAGASATAASDTLESALQKTWQLRDLQAEIVPRPETQELEVRTARVFFDDPLTDAILRATNRMSPSDLELRGGSEPMPLQRILQAADQLTKARPVLTYLVNLLVAGARSTPYSMVTAAGPPYTPVDLHQDEIVINQWLADDLGAKPGDLISLVYFDPEAGTRLLERTNAFRVRSVIPLELPWADRSLMPEFPGIEKAESTHDWDAGFPLVYKIRAQDEGYWKKYRGTPKAFVSLAAGQKMWANRFGSVTAVRFPVPAVTSGVQFFPDFGVALERKILANLRPQGVGLRFEPAREQALKAANQAQDFGQLFLGFSFFLVIAALLLMALLFQFGLEQRGVEVGTFLALGFRPRQVRRLLLLEAVVLALLGGVIGAFAGLGYARGMLYGLATVWRGAVGRAALEFHVTPATLTIGALASTAVAILTIWLTLRKQARQPARELLSGETEPRLAHAAPRRAWWLALILTVAGMATLGWSLTTGNGSNAEAFFSAGALLLLAGLAATSGWLRSLARHTQSESLTLSGLGVRTCARRRKRSLATVALLGSGCFLIVAIGVFRLDAARDASRRDSGTGGFALIGEAALPVLQDLNARAGREFFGLGADQMQGVNVVAFRVHDGDEASCLNLNRAQRPRLLGVKPELLSGRFTFADVAGPKTVREGWQLLQSSPEEVPAIGDANSIQWALGKKLGDTLDYTDERGRPFKLRLVGAVANSILQGSLIIDESQFLKHFPNESGYRTFLIDVPPGATAQVSATLSRALQDLGLELSPTVQRLVAFNAVQNTYLGTFQILGGLGLLLGSAGLGVVVLRNVLERRGELGLLIAVGFRRRLLHRMVLFEHGALLALGLGIGIVAAAVAVLPALTSDERHLPYLSLGLTLLAVLLNGALWTWIATRFALRGDLLAALRNE